MAQLICKDLTLGYENGAILQGLSFSVEKGDYLAIVGENGSGKSTLMKTILGLMKPLKGEVLLGDDLKKYEIGYLPQQSPIQKDFRMSGWRYPRHRQEPARNRPERLYQVRHLLRKM